ncbi:secretogranin-2a isoform 2-T2 [Menidia menidia]
MLGSRAAPQHRRTTRDVTMPSLPSASRPVKPFLPRLVDLPLVLLFLASSSYVDGVSLGRPGSPAEPSADMLKALEYVQSLHRRSDWGLRPPAPPAVRREDPGEAEEGEGGEDRSEELLRAVISTLRQTERASGPRGAEGGYPRGPDAANPPPRRTPKPEEGDEEEDEDEEEAGYDKRTNENVEEKYTPQSLATLQSVFDELDKLTGSKVAQKRQDEEDDEEDEEGNEDLFNGGNAVFDEMGRDRGPPEDEEEEEEEEGDGNNEDYPGFDYIDNNDEEDDEEEDDPSFLVKRSSDANDLASLMDYYLLRVLEKTEEEQRKLKEQEEEENRNNLDPRVVYRLLTVAQKYQIPPGDLMDLLKTGNGMSSDKLRKTNGAPRAKSRFLQASLKKPYQIPEEQFYGRKTPEERRTEDILRMLGLGGEDASRQPSPFRPRPVGQFVASSSTQRRLPKPLRDDYDDTADQDQDQDQDRDRDRDQDELAAYLAARMLARYPKPALFSNSNKQKQEEDRPRGAGSFKKAVEKYFDLMESNRSPNEKRQSEDDGRSEGFENEAVMKLLSYLNPETEESDAKTA